MFDYSKAIAKAGLELGAFKINAENPFQWASGYRMPLYNDNRMFLFKDSHRQMINSDFEWMIEEAISEFDISSDCILAGTSTAGIPWASFLANNLGSPLIYIRDKPKDHGLKNQIEGIGAEKDLGGMNVIVIEDLISTGGSSVAAVQAVRDANGICNHCFSVFSYGFKEADEMFEGKRAYDKDKLKFLTHPCNVKSILDYDTLLGVAIKTGYLNENQIELLQDWRKDPWNWGAKHGFPKVDKK